MTTISRPFGVSLLTVLIVIGGVAYLLGGIVLAIAGGAGANSTVLVASGIIIALIGVIYLLVAKGLWNGSRGARFVVAIVTLLSLITASIQLIQPNQFWTGAGGIAYSLVVLFLLFNQRASAFFAQ